jgi:hypothetical protein
MLTLRNWWLVLVLALCAGFGFTVGSWAADRLLGIFVR